MKLVSGALLTTLRDHPTQICPLLFREGRQQTTALNPTTTGGSQQIDLHMVCILF